MLVVSILFYVTAYLAFGFAASRHVFVKSLGDKPRSYVPYPHAYPDVRELTDAAKSAHAQALAALWFWPLYLPYFLATGETPNEKNNRLEIERRKLHAQVRELEQERENEFLRLERTLDRLTQEIE